MHDESNEKINYYIKNILSFLKNKEQDESIQYSVLPSNNQQIEMTKNPIHDESNKK
jgi:hypothetical protein